VLNCLILNSQFLIELWRCSFVKIAFSTLGCPDWCWNDTIAAAKDLGYDGVEIRGIEHQIYLPKAPQLMGKYLQKTEDHLKQIKLEFSCLTSACYLHEDNFEARLEQGEAYIEMAHKVGVPFIRVLGDTILLKG